MMENSRIKTVNTIAGMTAPAPLPAESVKFDYYGEDVFNEAIIRQYLSESSAKQLIATINGEAPLNPGIASEVAQAMKNWALSRGATHFTHWFQPLTSGTAEKHDAFLERCGRDQAIMEFSGKNLIVGESDASSFPSGGLRCTFEARGYTAWDPTSPAFIKRHSNGATLCIPTIFCSFTGEVLDKKTPMLRSVQALGKSITRLMKCFGLPEQHTSVTLGIEQEYFLIDRHFYLQRPDLLQTGRTLFGAPPPKHQQLEDHYFGAIRPRILAFMTDVEKALWRLGIPAKTRHNEVAPAQFELAPLFEDINLAIDHNMLIMEVLRQEAERHGLVCLLHEKPFAGVNGSGKHNNWSVTYGTKNLLDPGDTPHENAIFLTVLAATIRAINLHSDLLRSITASAGNDHRLGANEAPPAIISIFLGDQLGEIIDNIAHGSQQASKRTKGTMQVGVDALPILPRDATDRNRTSPFAFTGNKFEFRAPGSSQSCANPNTVLNTIIAESIDYITDQILSQPGKDFNKKLQGILQRVINDNRRVIFNGDNYNEAWRKEAAKRGLPNFATTPEALAPLLLPENQALFAKYGVFTEKELESRYEVFKEDYERKIRIEGEIAVDIVETMILPAVCSELNEFPFQALSKVPKETPLAAKGNMLIEKYNALSGTVEELRSVLKAKSGKEADIIAKMKEIREMTDGLEHIVDDRRWPLPKYREMLFIY